MKNEKKNHKTYIVLPGFQAGMLTSQDLEKLTSLVNRYNVPMTKVTGADRIAFLGMDPEQLTGLQDELKISGQPPHQQNHVHYVQACPGSDWCKYGVDDAPAMGKIISAMELDGPLPAKVKVGISGCRMCCCQSWVRDVGLAAEKKGWRFTFGGNGAGNPRIGDLIAEGLSVNDAVNLVKKTLNYYIAEAKYKTRSARFMERIGADTLKKAILD